MSSGALGVLRSVARLAPEVPELLQTGQKANTSDFHVPFLLLCKADSYPLSLSGPVILAQGAVSDSLCPPNPKRLRHKLEALVFALPTHVRDASGRSV